MAGHPGQPFRIAFVGDIYLGPGAEPWMSAGVPELHGALGVDVVVGNFESVIDGPSDGEPRPGKIRLSVPRSSVVRLKEVGVDAVSVANNHIGDYGPGAASRTVSTLSEVFGDGNVFGHCDRPAAEPAPGLRVVAACFPETNPVVLAGAPRPCTARDLDALLEKGAGSTGRLVVYAHWGEEYLSLTAPGLRERARRLRRAGAAHVVGTHSHVVGAAETLDGFSATYSLGNFLFHPVREEKASLLRRTKRGTVAVFRWDGEALTLDEFWTSEFDEGLNLRLRKLGQRRPGSSLSQLHLRVPEPVARWSYDVALGWRVFDLGLAKLVEGVERPSLRKVRTALAQLGRRAT